jgi:hypothetical protein
LTNSTLMNARRTIYDLEPRDAASWLNVKALARFEATSEDSRYPIESVFEEHGQGWRAVEVGEQAIRLIFDEPQRIKRIRLCFQEPDTERTQQFTLHWSTDNTPTPRPLVRQQWDFNPPASVMQIEEYEVDLNGVRMLQLVVSPEIKRGPAIATLVSWHLG